MESIWVTNWFQRILEIKKNLGNRNKLIIVDRSPYSAVYYAGAKVSVNLTRRCHVHVSLTCTGCHTGALDHRTDQRFTHRL